MNATRDRNFTGDMLSVQQDRPPDCGRRLHPDESDTGTLRPVSTPPTGDVVSRELFETHHEIAEAGAKAIVVAVDEPQAIATGGPNGPVSTVA